MGIDPALAETQRAIWERIAPFWASAHPEDARAQTVWTPAPPPSLVTPGARVLELGCGAGARAVALAELGAHVTATDVSSAFVAIAAERGAAFEDRFTTQLLDAQDAASLASLDGSFDGVVADMVLMNLFDLRPLAEALPRILSPGGWFAALVLHPCFGSPYFVDTDERGRPVGGIGRLIAWGQQVARFVPPRVVVALSKPLRPLLARPRPYNPEVVRRVAMPGQPEPHYNVHRPISALLAPFFAAGLVLDDLLEGSAPDEVEPGLLYVCFRRPA